MDKRLNLANKFYAKYFGIKPLTIETWQGCAKNDIAQINPAKNSIEINTSRNLDTQIIGLAHEYVHITQVIRGDLRQKNGVTYWQNKACFADYKSQPWEIEARKLQFELFRLFNQSKKQ